MSNTVLDTAGAAEFTGLGKPTLEKMRVRGDGPPYMKLGAKSVRYRADDLREWMAARVVTSTSQKIAA